MFAHMKIMNEFTTPFVRTTKLGYCLSTMEVAVNHILELTKEDLIDENDQNNIERRMTIIESLRQSFNVTNRTMSLKILDDPFDEFFNYEKKI